MSDKDDREKRETEKRIITVTAFTVELLQVIETFMVQKLGAPCACAVMTRPDDDMLYASNMSRDEGLKSLKAYVAEIEKSEPYEGNKPQIHIRMRDLDDK